MTSTVAYRHKYYLEHKDYINELNKKWYQINKEKKLKQSRELGQSKKITALSHYSNGSPVCAQCGITDTDILTLHHANGGGNKHRQVVGSNMYRWVINTGFPAGFQVLCFNCNWKKRIKEEM